MINLISMSFCHVSADDLSSMSQIPFEEICESLGVEMMGKEHSGLDDSFMVLLLGGMSTNHGKK